MQVSVKKKIFRVYERNEDDIWLRELYDNDKYFNGFTEKNKSEKRVQLRL